MLPCLSSPATRRRDTVLLGSVLLCSALLFCTSCNDKDDDTAAEGCASLSKTFPLDGATDVDLATDVSFALSIDSIGEPAITTDIPGTPETTDDPDGLGKTVHWRADGLLPAASTVHFELSWCGGTETLDFSTLSPGNAPAAESLSGITWVADLQSGHLLEPAGAGDTIIGELVIPPILLSPTSAEPLAIRGGMSRTGTTEQDWCAETLDFTDVDYSAAPYFTMSADAMQIPVSGATSAVNDIRIAGVISEDGATLEHVTLWGLIDMRDASEPTGYTNDELCSQVLPQLGTSCEECPDGQKYCLTLGFDQITATSQAGTIDAVSGLNCEGCETAVPADDATCEE